MATLLRYVLGGVVDVWRRARIREGRVGVDELVCSVFADELSAIRQAGLSRKYMDRCEALSALRGRPDFIANFPWNERGMTSIACRYHELTADNLDNQLLRAALERATLMQTSGETSRRLLEHRRAWSEIASLRVVGRIDFGRAREQYTRLSEHYRLAHNLAELIILGHMPSAIYEEGPVPTGGLCLDMAYLFESFVNRLLSEYLGQRGLVVRPQERDRAALLDRKGSPYRRIQPDVVVYRSSLPVAVVDAKYKQYWPAAADELPERKISNEDLYQLFFYGQRLQLRHGLKSAPAAFIIAPLPAADERERAVIDDRFTLVQWRAGSQEGCSVGLLLLPLTDILRNLAHGVRNRDALHALDALWELAAA